MQDYSITHLRCLTKSRLPHVLAISFNNKWLHSWFHCKESRSGHLLSCWIDLFHKLCQDSVFVAQEENADSLEIFRFLTNSKNFDQTSLFDTTLISEIYNQYLVEVFPPKQNSFPDSWNKHLQYSKFFKVKWLHNQLCLQKKCHWSLGLTSSRNSVDSLFSFRLNSSKRKRWIHGNFLIINELLKSLSKLKACY